MVTAAGPKVLEFNCRFGDPETQAILPRIDGDLLPALTACAGGRLRDGDEGPNTGGMGAYSPAPIVTPTIHARVLREIILPTVQGMAADGIEYTGFLYAGLMIDARGNPRTLEFNCRMGDPETQPIMLRLKSDLVDLLEHAIDGTLDEVEAEWDRRTALGVVLAAAGYPEEPRRGDPVIALPADSEDCVVFHAGTQVVDAQLATSGGRVLTVTALGDSVRAAQRRAYDAVAQVRFAGQQYRTDIGHRAINRRAQAAAPAVPRE
jgi:phosphoribosylamine--glycine ligase